MATLIAGYDSNGCTGRCDAKCYEATSSECICICCGMNHGVGLNRACENTAALAERWIDEWKKQHPDTERFEVPEVQLPLF